MADPRLNSVHLDPARRDEFRRARDALLSARGQHTHYAELHDIPPPEADSRTLVERLGQQLPPDYDYAVLDKDAVYPLKVGLNTIGRLPDNDVVVPDPFVSRRHCAILVHSTQGCELHDVASKNGTFLNGRRLAGPTPLVSGDEIRMCDRQMVFIRKQDPAQADENEVTRAD
ncbi:MAG TPA: FHA domain-containing protein [Gemmataceae bacterium]|nr:FHA domain-containing protein [Gemmataceae bacterium]